MHIVLFQPEIAPNTGNIIRLCANIGAALHLIRPLGFELDDRRLRRAGLDYHEFTPICVHDSIDIYLTAALPKRLFACTTKGGRSYAEVEYHSGDALLFGPESRGLPPDILAGIAPENRLRLPMRPQSRSLNLANAVAVFAYEAWRQAEFVGATHSPASGVVALQ